MTTKRLHLKVETQGAKQAETQFRSLGKSVSGTIQAMTLLKAAAAGLAVTGLGKIIYELSKTAAEVKDVKFAFDNLNSPNLLDRMREATRGTVTDLELMKQSVMARNFQISLEHLPKFFEFASKRARETGQSVDYLVNSIILGIGRKSPLILDNLGISALRVREEFQKTGDMSKAVGKIIDEEMGKASGATEFAGDKFERLQASIGNTAATIGARLLPMTGKVLDGANVAVTALGNLFRNFAEETRNASMLVVRSISMVTELTEVQSVIDALRNLSRSVLESGNIGNVQMMIKNFSLLTQEQKNAVIAGNDFWEVSRALGDAANDLQDKLDKSVQGYKKFNWEIEKSKNIYAEWRAKQLEKIAADKQEAEWMAFLNQELLAWVNTMEAVQSMPDWHFKTAPAKRGMEELIEVTAEYANSVETTYGPAVVNMANMMAGSLQSAIVNQWESGADALENFGRVFENLAAQVLAKAAIFGLFNLLSGGGFSTFAGGFKNFMFGFASGGRPTGPSIVGEHGPEMFVPDRSGTIIPSHKMSNTFNLHFNGPVTNTRWVRDAVVPEIKRAVRLGYA